jgi:hypothetical protein
MTLATSSLAIYLERGDKIIPGKASLFVASSSTQELASPNRNPCAFLGTVPGKQMHVVAVAETAQPSLHLSTLNVRMLLTLLASYAMEKTESLSVGLSFTQWMVKSANAPCAFPATIRGSLTLAVAAKNLDAQLRLREGLTMKTLS